MPLNFDPPLLNSASPWATTKEDLEALYDCPFTGAVTTRTCTLAGFTHKSNVHQHCFFNTSSFAVDTDSANQILEKEAAGSRAFSSRGDASQESSSSLNTYGYSPVSLRECLATLSVIFIARKSQPQLKPVIVSISGDLESTSLAIDMIAKEAENLHTIANKSARLLIEINLSCPNIHGRPPPAYSMDQLKDYLQLLTEKASPQQIGIKLPPYTYEDQFTSLTTLLQSFHPTPLAFITTTNTLGSSLVLSADSSTPVLNSESGTGIGGLAGPALHPLSLGNVATLRRKLNQHDSLDHIEIIGVGGVSDRKGYERMRNVGAAAVGVGTALGVWGVGVFEGILERRER